MRIWSLVVVTAVLLFRETPLHDFNNFSSCLVQCGLRVNCELQGKDRSCSIKDARARSPTEDAQYVVVRQGRVCRRRLQGSLLFMY